MCTNKRHLINKYTHEDMWVDCGHCKACLQNKAFKQSNRIRNEYSEDWKTIFCTLTYDKFSCPFFYHSDFIRIRQQGFGDLPIYRHFKCRWNPNRQSYDYDYSINKPFELFKLPLSERISYYDIKDLNFKYLKKGYGKVGVCYYKDVQDFFKRFRLQLQRKGICQRIKFYSVSEYGSKSARPHFHFLLQIPTGCDEKAVRQIFIASWPYGYRVRYDESFKLVYDDPAGYVSSYVNCAAYVSPFLADYFKSKHSSSKLFGHGRDVFQLDKVVEKIESGTLDFTIERIRKGVVQIDSFPFPKYVINRFFPLFKGYSRLVDFALSDYLSPMFFADRLRSKGRYYDSINPSTRIDYSSEDLKKIYIRLNNAYEYYKGTFPNTSFLDYMFMYHRAWSVYKSTTYKYFVSDEEINDFYKYDNMCLLPQEQQIDFHTKFGNGCRFIVDVNEKPQYVNQTIKMSAMYDGYDKSKKVHGFVLEDRYM